MDHHISRYLFKDPTLLNPVYLTELEDHVKPSREEITEAIQKNIITDNLENVYAHSTGWDLDLKSDIIFTVVKSMKQALHEIVDEMTSKGSNSGNCVFDYNLLNCWGVIYKEGDSTKDHWHYPCTMSQVYYVSVESNSSPLIFTDLDVEITPESGMLITFPSYLMHSVSPLEKDDQRVVISVNWLFSERKQSNGSN
jgi:hypothetical protein